MSGARSATATGSRAAGRGCERHRPHRARRQHLRHRRRRHGPESGPGPGSGPGRRPPHTAPSAAHPAPPHRPGRRHGRGRRGRRAQPLSDPPPASGAAATALPVADRGRDLQGRHDAPTGGDGTFSFTVSVSQDSGPPVSVRRITQPSEALSVTVAPHTPFDVKTGSPRTARITMHIRECRNVQRNAGLPFLAVTLRNVRAKQLQSFILGERYAKDLSRALTAACPPNTDVMSKTP